MKLVEVMAAGLPFRRNSPKARGWYWLCKKGDFVFSINLIHAEVEGYGVSCPVSAEEVLADDWVNAEKCACGHFIVPKILVESIKGY